MSNPIKHNKDVPHPRLQGFQEYYETEIAPWMEGQVGKHERAKGHFYLIAGLGLLLLPVLLWISVNAFYIQPHEFLDFDGVPIFILAVYLMAVFGAAYYPLHKLNKLSKNFLVDKICSFLDLEYDIDGGAFPLEVFEEVELLPCNSCSELKDYFYGHFEGIDFSFAECKLTSTNMLDGTSHTDYHGILFQFTLPQSLNEQILITHNPGFENFHHKGELLNKKQRVIIDDPSFEQNFTVYATDETEARSLLTPAVRKLITGFTDKLKKRPYIKDEIQLAFKGSHLLLAVPIKESWFEGGCSFQSMNDPARVERILEEISVAYEMVELL